MPKFRKKDSDFEAVQFNPGAKMWMDADFPDGVRSTHYMEVSDLMGGTSGCTRDPEGWIWSCCGVLENSSGKLVVAPGDWILTDPNGEKHLCKKAVFAATYEPVED